MKNIIIECLTYILNKLRGKTVNNTPRSISSLAPRILTEEKDLKRIKPYIIRLKNAIDEKDITNIALTGSYGSGKSTILNTFQYLYPDYEYINISLASFKDNKQEDDNLDRQLEVSILQQIFYHVKPSRIPDSRFKRIINLTTKRLLIISFSLIVWILSAFILFKFGYIEKLNPNTWNFSQRFSWTTFLSSIIFFSGIGSFSRILIRLFINSKINKLNIKGEVELGNDIDKSVFNEHLEEIIYFFQRTEYNVVIIEDLDRFNNTDIFTKLREINILLNKSELIEREINFIYAIRDEMFTDKTERVKFFEYIIPVIPFINPSNAGEQLTKLIKESDLEGVLSKDFTEDVVTFIDDIDMRLLTNIFHEYVLYKDSLKDLVQDNLFAIITYKNLFPDDFGKLHKREGNLYEFISKKKEHTKSVIDKHKKTINLKESKIKEIESETIGNITELRAVYIQAILNKIPNVLAFKIDDERVPFSDVISDHYFSELSSNQIEYYSHIIQNRGYNNSCLAESLSTSSYSFTNIENEVSSNLTYLEREQAIKDRENGEINKLKTEIANIQSEISTIEDWNLTKIIQEIGFEVILEKEEEKEEMKPLDHRLIRNLLIGGRINENYLDYISIFHGVNMTSQEYSFVRKIKSGANENFEYSLINVGEIVKKLPIRYFKSEAILNFDIFDYLSQNYDSYKEQYESIIELVKKKSDNSLKFMDEYISNEKEYIPFFIHKLSKSWNDFWDFIHEQPIYTSQKKDKYLYLILVHASVDTIYSLDKSLKLASYIETHEKFISLFTDEDYFDKVTSTIKKLNIYFEKLECPNDENEGLFQYIYENDNYRINMHNITLLLNSLYKGHSEGAACWNYTTILNSNCEPLKRYVQEFLVDYLEKVFLKLPDNNNESEETLLLLLNNEKLAHNIKVKILQKQQTKIQDITNTEDRQIEYELFKNNRIEPTWGNVITHYDCIEEKIIDDALIEFLNIEENYKALNKEDFTHKADATKEFRENLLKTNSLSFESYKALIIKTPNNWNILDFSHLDQNKVEWLIENKLNLTKNNFDILKLHFSAISIRLIEKKHYELMTKYDELELNIDDHIKILQSTVITQSTKEEIIGKINNEWIIENDQLKVLIKNILYQSSEHILEYEALDAIIGYSKNNDKRLHLIYNHIGGLEKAQTQTLLEKLGYDYKKIFENQKKPTFSYTSTKENIFKYLEVKGMISSCKVKDDKSKIRVVALYK